MAIQQTVYFSVTMPDKYDRPNGWTFNAPFSGASVPYNAVIDSVYLTLTIKNYVPCSVDFGTYGKIEIDAAHNADATLRLNMKNFTASQYKGVSSGSLPGKVIGSGSVNIINFRSTSATLEVTYTINDSSTITSSKDPVAQGDSTVITISAPNPYYTHSLTFSIPGGTQQTVSRNTLGTNRSYTFTVPSNWPTGTATCTVSTYTSTGDYIGSSNCSFVVMVDPVTITPVVGNFGISIVQSQFVPSTWGNTYVKGHSAARLSVPDASPGSASTLQSIELICGSQSQITEDLKTFTTNEIEDVGAVSCVARVTNTAGNTATEEETITVYDYDDPQIVNVQAYRSDANGTPVDTGRYIAVMAAVNFSSVGGNNQLAFLQARYRKSSDSWSTAVDITNGVTSLLAGNLDPLDDSSFEVQIIAIDTIQNNKGESSSVIEGVLTTDITMHFLDGGSNVSIGFRGTVPFAFQLSPNWKFMQGNKEIDLGTRELDELPTPGSQNTVKSGGMYTAIQALLPTPLNLSIAPSAWTYSGDKYVYEYQADVTAKTTIIGNFTDEIGAQSIKSGILITPSAGRIIFQTDLLPTDTVNLGLLLQDIYENASPFFLHKGKGGDTPYDAITQFVVSQQVTNPVENVNMVMLMPNGYVAAILDVLWSTYSSVKVAAIPRGFRPGSTQSISTKYYSSASGGVSGYDTTVTINPFGDVQVSSVSPSYYYGISRMFAYYQKSDQEETYGAFEIVSGGYLDGETIITNKITKAGNMVKYEFEASFSEPKGIVASRDIGIHAPNGFLPYTSPLYPTGYVIFDGDTAETSRPMRMITSTDYSYVWFDSVLGDTITHFRFEFATTAKTT